MPSSSIDPNSAPQRARVRFQIDDRIIRLEIIAQASGQGLVVVGLAQYGARLFAVHQQGVELEIIPAPAAEGAAVRELEQMALWVMDALHRSYWIRSEATQSNEPHQEWRWNWGEEQVVETRTAATLHREFVSHSSATEHVAIDYPEYETKGYASTAQIQNPWCGYHAVIVPIQN